MDCLCAGAVQLAELVSYQRAITLILHSLEHRAVECFNRVLGIKVVEGPE
jgi:hypothetical protein